jgi:hypothetical protein
MAELITGTGEAMPKKAARYPASLASWGKEYG